MNLSVLYLLNREKHTVDFVCSRTKEGCTVKCSNPSAIVINYWRLLSYKIGAAVSVCKVEINLSILLDRQIHRGYRTKRQEWSMMLHTPPDEWGLSAVFNASKVCWSLDRADKRISQLQVRILE